MPDAPLFTRLDDFGLLMIEQPLAPGDLVDHAKLQRRLNTAICLDESIVSLANAQHAHELGACRIINIKLGRVGGYSEAKEIQAFAQAHGMPVWCGGMLEAGIGRAHNIALSTLSGFTLPGDVSASHTVLGKGHHRAAGGGESERGRSPRRRVTASGSRSTKPSSMP